MSPEEIFKRYAKRIVFLTCEVSANETNLASGVLVSDDGFIVTNAHVVEGCRTITATYIAGALRRSYEAMLKYYDKRTDTAVLKLPVRGLDHFDLGPWVKYQEVRVGTRVYAIGNPRGLEQSISEGIVSGNREQDGASWIQHSASISPGSSCGALISSRGELLGINSFLLTNSQNLNFAVPVSTLVAALSRADTELTGTYSGVVQNLTAGLSAEIKILVTESSGAVHGCMAVKLPLLGSGYLRGTVHGLQFSFVVVSDSARITLDGQRDANKLRGTYSVSIPNGGSEQNGTFMLHKNSAEGPSSGFNIQSCPNDATLAREAAEQGDVSAQLSIGLLYFNGQGVPQDYAQAATWWRKAAEQGYAEAQTFLGYLYEAGKGVPQDYAEAATWFRKAADQGNARAQYRLGGLYEEGHGFPQDYAQAAAWYRKAAEQGHAPAQLSLGVSYEYGTGVPQDYGESYFWVKVAAAGKIPSDAKPADIAAMLDVIATHLTTAALSQAQERAREWLAAHPSPQH